MKVDMEGKVYLGFDIETTGQFPTENSMIALGMFLVDNQGKELNKFFVCLKEDGMKREERCMTEFWGNFAELWEFIQTSAIEPLVAMQLAVEWLSKIEMAYGDRLVVLSDNASYDVAWINMYLSRYHDFLKRPMLYYGLQKNPKWKENADPEENVGQEEFTYQYRRIWDTDSAFHGALVLEKGESIEWKLEDRLGVQNPKWKNSHHPEEDAANIATNYALFLKKYCGEIQIPFKKSKSNSSEVEEESCAEVFLTENHNY